jgi:hypothetical protein
MFHKIILPITLIILLSACNGELPIGSEAPLEPEQPVIATPITTELPTTGETPVMVEPPEQMAPRPINSEYLPQREDGNLTRGNVFIDNSELLIMESYPIQVALTLKGSLPTPCNQLRVIAKPPDEQNQIQVEVYSVIDPEQVCTQVLQPFEANIGLGSFPSGHYTVWVNGDQIGEFDA